MPSDSVPIKIDATSSSSDDLEQPLSSSAASNSSIAQRAADNENIDKQARFMLPGMNGSPPKVLTMDEVKDCVKNLEDMTLLHEIAINPEFKLRPFEPPANSLERRVKDMIHEAFWDVLRSQLNQTPPCYDQAIQLLSDVKEYFDHIFMANNKKIMEHICAVLDSNLIRQQAEQDCIDFKGYASFVIDIMAKSCAPIRDEQVARLREIDDVVDTFRGILECLSIMRLDVANCLLDATRSEVVSNSIEYEKKKFKKHLETYTLGFPATEAWLRRNMAATVTAAAPPQTAGATPRTESSSQPINNGKHTISNAYLELIDWNAQNDFPELLDMDEARIRSLQTRALQLCTCVSTMAIASGVPTFSQNPNLKKSFANDLKIITQNLTYADNAEVNMDNVWMQLRAAITKHREQQNQPAMDEQTEQTLKNQVLQLAKPEAPVRTLMWNRQKIYLRLCLYSNQMPTPPPGFQEFYDELESLCKAFKVITSYNYAVFGEYYQELLDKMRDD